MNEVKIIKSAIFPALLSFALFAFTLLLTYRYISDRSWTMAEAHNQELVANLSATLDRECLIAERSVRSFLSAWFCYPEGDSVDFANSPVYIKDSDIAVLKQEGPKRLDEFVKANNLRYTSADFIFASDTAASSLLKKISLTEDMWTVPEKDSPLYGNAMAYYVPLLREDGSLFGVFTIGASQDYIERLYAMLQPYQEGQSEVRIVDEQGNIFISSRSYEGKGKSYIFRDHLKRMPYDAVIECSEKAIYSYAYQTIKVVFLVSFVSLALMLLCMALFYRRVMARKRERILVQNELQMAANVQQKMLKANEDSGAGYELKAWLKPALEAGGDLYDYVHKPSGILLLTGDVSGKGMPAALFMSQVVSLFRSEAARSDDPAVIVSRINEVLSQENPSNMFCTMVVGHLCTDTGRLQLCNAGHNAPVLLRGGSPEFLDLTRHLPVAIDENFVYKNDTLTLSRGDVILLYTDGVTEARDSSHALFGNDRLLASLAANGLDSFDPLLSDISAFVGDESQSDDITLLMCRYDL